jgi:hypothetical protein
MADDAPNPRIFEGANNPPAPDPFEAVRIHCEDLYMEAKHWLDGAAISSDAEAATVEKLLDDARKAWKAADDARIEENAPFDLGKAKVQEKYAPLVADTKKTKGTMVRMQEACKAALEPWRKAKLAEAQAAAAAAAKEAEDKAQAAALAMRSSAGNLEEREQAEELVKAAEDAQRDAKRATKAATTGTGLTTFWRAEMTNQKEAILHYMKNDPVQFVALAQRLADADVYAGKRTIPGFNIIEDKRAR